MLADHIHLSSSNAIANEDEQVLIYMIPGNPGLIEYYREYLSCLASVLGATENVHLAIHGNSLAGFELTEDESRLPEDILYDLEGQITFIYNQIQSAAITWKTTKASQSAEKLKVILIGHSIGAYILLEVIARRQGATRKERVESSEDEFEFVGGICLFPTIVEIAKSPSGRKASPLVAIPGFAFAIHTLVRCLCALVPSRRLLSVVKVVTGMPQLAAEVTTAFLRSARGVYQALHLTKYEFGEVTKDKWQDTLWAAVQPQQQVTFPDDSNAPCTPEFYFFWGENDHWVNNSARDRFISSHSVEAIGTNRKKLNMEIDMQNLPHAFCIRHSKIVATKTAEYINQILTHQRS